MCLALLPTASSHPRPEEVSERERERVCVRVIKFKWERERDGVIVGVRRSKGGREDSLLVCMSVRLCIYLSVCLCDGRQGEAR